jgi:pSer/pThr/pTyr-binding forkhead associated (FHA) protein
LAVVVLSIVGGVLLLAALAGILWWAQRSPHRQPGQSSPPPIVFLPVSDGLPADHAPPRRTPEATRAVPYAPTPPRYEEADSEPLVLSMSEDRDVAEAGGNGWRRRERARVLRAESGDAAATPSVLTGTLRMLPGRLEVMAGLPVRSEIRFVQTGGAAEQEVTLGRQEGRPYEHVQLASQTVSRLHAAMTYGRGRWRIANLSETNPLRVNGTAVGRETPPVELADGDTIELGEVVLRFRA